MDCSAEIAPRMWGDEFWGVSCLRGVFLAISGLGEIGGCCWCSINEEGLRCPALLGSASAVPSCILRRMDA